MVFDRIRENTKIDRKTEFITAVNLVGGAYFKGVEFVQHIQLAHDHLAEAVDLAGIARGYGVEPAAPAFAPGGGAKLMPSLLQAVSGVVLQLGGEGAAAHPGGVGFEDPDQAVDLPGRNAEPGLMPPHRGVRGCHVGVSAHVEIEQYPLGPFDQNILAVTHGLMQGCHRVGQHRCAPVGGEQETLYVLLHTVQAIFVDLSLTETHFQPFDQVLAELGNIGHIIGPDAQTAGFVRIGGADPPSRGADDMPRGPVHCLMNGRDDVGGIAEEDAALGVDAVLLQLIDLIHQGHGIHHHTVPQNTDSPLVEDTGRDLVQNEGFFTDLDGMSGVGAALVTGHNIDLIAQQVDNFALALVAPLASNNSCNWHNTILRGPQ
ncbi:hypothetical protein ES708_10315 [subsurface metagenome]